MNKKSQTSVKNHNNVNLGDKKSETSVKSHNNVNLGEQKVTN